MNWCETFGGVGIGVIMHKQSEAWNAYRLYRDAYHNRTIGFCADEMRRYAKEIEIYHHCEEIKTFWEGASFAARSIQGQIQREYDLDLHREFSDFPSH